MIYKNYIKKRTSHHGFQSLLQMPKSRQHKTRVVISKVHKEKLKCCDMDKINDDNKTPELEGDTLDLPSIRSDQIKDYAAILKEGGPNMVDRFKSMAPEFNRPLTVDQEDSLTKAMTSIANSAIEEAQFESYRQPAVEQDDMDNPFLDLSYDWDEEGTSKEGPANTGTKKKTILVDKQAMNSTLDEEALNLFSNEGEALENPGVNQDNPSSLTTPDTPHDQTPRPLADSLRGIKKDLMKLTAQSNCIQAGLNDISVRATRRSDEAETMYVSIIGAINKIASQLDTIDKRISNQEITLKSILQRMDVNAVKPLQPPKPQVPLSKIIQTRKFTEVQLEHASTLAGYMLRQQGGIDTPCNRKMITDIFLNLDPKKIGDELAHLGFLLSPSLISDIIVCDFKNKMSLAKIASDVKSEILNPRPKQELIKDSIPGASSLAYQREASERAAGYNPMKNRKK